jgi:hypothetical protein
VSGEEWLLPAALLPTPPEPEPAPPPAELTECPNCGEGPAEWSWSLDRVSEGPVGHNRLGLSDVTAVLVLGCDSCSETLALVRQGTRDADTVVDYLTRATMAGLLIVPAKS